MTTPQQRAEWRRIAEQATKGPLTAATLGRFALHIPDDEVALFRDEDGDVLAVRCATRTVRASAMQDAALIAIAREAILALTQEVEEAEAEVASRGLSLRVLWGDLNKATAACGMTDDECPLDAILRVVKERDAARAETAALRARVRRGRKRR